MDVDYDSEDIVLTGWLYKINAPEFNRVNRSQIGRGTDFIHDIVEYIGNNFYKPTNGNSFLRGVKFLTGKVYTEEFLTFIQTEQRQSNVMTSARSQPFRGKYNKNIGCFDGIRVCPRKITKKIKHHLCTKTVPVYFWKSDTFDCNKAIEELKLIFKVVDNVISDKHVESYIKEEYKLEKVQSQLTKMIVYNIKTCNTFESVPYASCINRLSKLSGENKRDITEREYENGKNDCNVFKGLDINNEILDSVLEFEREAKRINNKSVR